MNTTTQTTTQQCAHVSAWAADKADDLRSRQVGRLYPNEVEINQALAWQSRAWREKAASR